MRTSPADVKLAYAVPLIDRSTAGSAPVPSGVGADQSVPAARTMPYTTPPLTKTTASRPPSEAPTTGCELGVASAPSRRSAAWKTPPSKRATKT